MVWEVDAISAKTNSTTQDVRKGGKKRITGDKQRKGLGTSRAKSFTVRRIWVVGIANDIEWLIYKTIQYKLFAVINLTQSQ